MGAIYCNHGYCYQSGYVITFMNMWKILFNVIMYSVYVIFFFTFTTFVSKLAVLAQVVACLPLVQHVWGSIPGGIVNFYLKIFNLRARRGGDVHFLITRLYITVLD